MNEDTWAQLEKSFHKWPQARATPVTATEFDQEMRPFLPIDADYREFVLRYGGAIVGPHPIYGLRKPCFMGTVGGKATATELTLMFRETQWKGIDQWLIFSIDQGGNPIGFAADGAVWLSDQTNFGQVLQIASGFEDYLLKWCLKTRPVT